MIEFHDRRLDKLRHIESRDPNSGSRRPTSKDYAAHKKWAVSTYGKDVWSQYQKGGWDPKWSQEV